MAQTNTITQDRPCNRLKWARQVLQNSSLTLTAIASDASSRSYWRACYDGPSRIVMDSQHDDVTPWLNIGSQLAAVGLHVPAVHAQDTAQGFLLLEDLGSTLYLDVLNESRADALYNQAMDALLVMQTRVSSTELPKFDRAVLQSGLDIMPAWFLEQHLGHAPDGRERKVIHAAFDVIVQNALEQPKCFVHRDFHSRNLMLLADHGLGIIDFQGALHGPITYDLASLLRDAYIAWPLERIGAWVESYRRHLIDSGILDAGVDTMRFRRWFDLTGLHRHVRVLGQFYRLWYRDGKKGYLKDVPQVYRYVMDVARSYPELNDFANLLAHHAEGLDLTQVRSA